MGNTQDTLVAKTKTIVDAGAKHLAEMKKASAEARLAWSHWNDALHNQNGQDAAKDQAYQVKLGKLIQDIKTMDKSVKELATHLSDLATFRDDKKNRMLPMFTATGLPKLKKHIAAVEATKRTWDHEVKEANGEKVRAKPTGKGN